MNKKLTITVIFIIFIIAGLTFFFRTLDNVDYSSEATPTPSVKVSNFEECIDAGNPVMESYPRKCAADGITYVEDVGNEPEKRELIQLEIPNANEIVKSPLELKGKARGSWYFEASFPIYIYDALGNELGSTVAQAKTEWMTTEFVDFETVLKFTPPGTDTGELVLKKDNPSGLPENDDELRIPVKFR